MRLSSQLSRAPSWFTTIAHREDATPVICFRAPPGTLSPSRRPCRKGARSLPPGTSPSASPPLTPNVAPYSDGRATQSPGTPPLSPGLAAAPRGTRLTDLPPSCLRHLPLRLPSPEEPFSGSLPPVHQHPPFPPASLTVLHPSFFWASTPALLFGHQIRWKTSTWLVTGPLCVTSPRAFPGSRASEGYLELLSPQAPNSLFSGNDFAFRSLAP